VVVSPPAADGEQTQGVANGGVDLPGGWIGVGFGAALIAAATLVWKRRRHRYIPTPITSPTLDGPDLTAPLAALTRIRQTLRRNAPEALTEPDLGPTVHEWVRATIKPALPPVGPTGTDLAGVGELPMSAGLGLHGPAALDATRALLVAALTCGRPTDPDAKGEVVIPAATLATLLGVSAVDIGTIARLTVTPTFADAMTRIEEEIIRRTRVLAEAEAADITALRAGDSYAESLPQLLLIADVPDAGWHARLSTAIHLGRSAEIGAALLGQWPGGTTLTVAADGTTSGGVGERVAVLDTTAAAEMLAMLREAHDTAEIRTPAATSSRPSRERRVQADPASAPAVVDEPDDAVTCDAPARVERPVIASSASDPLPFTSAVAPVKVRVLGPPTILDVNGNPMRGMRAKSMELLVYLAVRKDGASLGDIMEAIWPDATMRRASERLSTCVANLRGVIRAAAQPDTSIAAMQAGDARKRLEPVVNTGGHYHLDAAIIDIDWWTVLDEYARVAVATDNGARLAHLHLAVAAMHGPLAAGCEYEWIDTDREYTRRHQIKIYAQAAALLTDTDSHQAKTLYDAACDLDPLSEELARHAMRAAAHVGDAEAISHRLATLRQQLCDIDTEVSTETEKLASSLRKDLARHDPDER
jgi:two-component SAPR family response regulator